MSGAPGVSMSLCTVITLTGGIPRLHISIAQCIFLLLAVQEDDAKSEFCAWEGF